MKNKLSLMLRGIVFSSLLFLGFESFGITKTQESKDAGSDIIADSYGYSSNINYFVYQANPISNTSHSVGVFKFTIRDGGGSTDADALATELTDITFTVSNIDNIRSAALFIGNGMKANNPTINTGGGTITFSGLSGADFTTPDNGSKTLTLRVSFNTTVADNEQMQFTISSATANAAGSVFATSNAGGASSSISGDDNRIEVTADRLAFSVQPANSTINVNLNSFTVAAVDANGSIDLDASATVTLTTAGTGLTASASYSLTSGQVVIDDVYFNVAQTTTLTASATGLTSGTSNSFEIADIVTPANSYRTTADGTLSGASWEQYVGTSWGSSSAPSNSTSNYLYIRNNISSGGAISASNIVIENGGTFTYTASSTCVGSIKVENGGTLQLDASLDLSSATLTVESGGKININFAADGSSSLWSGTEDFQDGSTIEIQDWDYANVNNSLVRNSSAISTNSGGYYFGNLILSGSPSSLFIVAEGTQTINLCQNDFTVSVSGNNVAFTDGGSNITVGGNIEVTSGQLSFAAILSGNPVTTVNGDLIANGGTISLNQISSVSATSTINLGGNLTIYSGSTLTSTDAGCKIVFSKTGTQTMDIAGALGSNVDFEVGSGSTAQIINQDLSLSNSSNNFTVLTGGILDFNYFDIIGSGIFALENGGTLLIYSADGVNASGATGNVQNTGSRTFSQTGYYHYVGNTTPQSTGTAMTSGSTAKRIVINKTNPTDIVNLTQSTGITGYLIIEKGVFTESATATITGSGELQMTDGEYRIAALSATVPSISGAYTLTGGTIHLNGTGAQLLRGGRDYYNLSFSGSGTKTISTSITNIGGASAGDGLVTISGNGTILDTENKEFSGNAGLIMTDNSTFRMSALNETLPELEGTYTLTGGTFEMYGTGSSQTHSLRGGIAYHNIELNSTAANTANDAANIVVSSGFSVAGTLNVNSPTCLKIGSLYTISGAGAFSLNAGATLKYGSANGITTSGASGNIQTTTRTFPTTASYGFVGSVDQNAGNGLPASMVNMYLDKTSATAKVTLPSSVSIQNTLALRNGILYTDSTGSAILELGISTAQLGSLDYINGYVVGQMRRWFNSTNSGNATGLFPLAVYRPAAAVYANRALLVEYTSAASSGGSLTAKWIHGDMLGSGLPIYNASSGGAGFDIVNTNSKGYWQVENAGGLSDGAYTLTATGEGFADITDISKLTLLKRVGSGNWTAPGSHQAPTGSIAAPVLSRTGLSGWSNYGFGGSEANPLPINLLSFTAQLQAEGVDLKWVTSSEINNDYFTVERGQDGRNFVEVGRVAGAGNSNVERHYSFLDAEMPQATTYYRLRQTDYNGTTTR